MTLQGKAALVTGAWSLFGIWAAGQLDRRWYCPYQGRRPGRALGCHWGRGYQARIKKRATHVWGQLQ